MENDLPRRCTYMAPQQSNESLESFDGKLCFVTIGATADFDSLIRAVVSETFILALKAHSYTDLLIQYGQDESGVYRSFRDLMQVEPEIAKGLKIEGFGFNKVGLGQEMRAATSGRNRREGVVISHAGKN